MKTKNKERSLVLPKGLSNMEVFGDLEKNNLLEVMDERNWKKCRYLQFWQKKGNRNIEWYLRMTNGIRRGIFFLGEKQ